MSKKELSASSRPWVPSNKGVVTGHKLLGANKMDSDLIEKTKDGILTADHAKREQEFRNLKGGSKYEPCYVDGIQKTPTEIALEKTRQNNKKLKILLTDAVSMQSVWKDKYEKLAGIEGEKEYWRKLCGLQMRDKVEFLLNKLEEEICTSCCERDENSSDWCPYGCYKYNSFVTNYRELIKNVFINELDEFSFS